MPRPLCFMVMPYGIKATQSEDGKGPDKINCDMLWEKALRPFIEEDLGYVAVESREMLGEIAKVR